MLKNITDNKIKILLAKTDTFIFITCIDFFSSCILFALYKDNFNSSNFLVMLFNFK